MSSGEQETQSGILAKKKRSFWITLPSLHKTDVHAKLMLALIRSVPGMFRTPERKPTKREHQSNREYRRNGLVPFSDIIKPRRDIVSFMPSSPPRRRQRKRLSSARYAPVCARGRPWSWHAWRPSPP